MSQYDMNFVGISVCCFDGFEVWWCQEFISVNCCYL